MTTGRQLAKIEFYFEQGKKVWNSAPEQVTSRQFYELWENIQRPSPFLIQGKELELLGFKFELPGSDEQPLACFCWNDRNSCAALRVESPEWEKIYLLFFSDGEPFVSEEETRFMGSDEVNHGEKLEIIYDLIEYIRKTAPALDIAGMKKKVFIEFLDQIAGSYDSKTVNSMRLMTVPFMQNMLKQAMADFATDEIGQQLSLPLDGNYSQNDDAEFSPAFTVRNLTDRVSAQTPWAIKRNLDFLLKACRLTVQNESEFVFSFADAEMLHSGHGEVAVSLKIADDAPLRHGDILNVKIRGENLVFGTFRVDIFDGNFVLGRLRCDDVASFPEIKKRLYGIQQKSPSEFIANLFEELTREVELDTKELGALAPILGFEPLAFDLANTGEAPKEMDASQSHAWRVAVNPTNYLTLIQGPPGTGKTYVLEQVVRELCRQQLRILISAPSNAAVDNICRRLDGLPLLRFGNNPSSIAPDIAAKNWIGERNNVARFVEMRKRPNCGGIYAGTHVGLLQDDIVIDDMLKNGRYDVIIFDEAGMTGLAEFFLCVKLGKRAILFGDHQQLPPFPLPPEVLERLYQESGIITHEQRALVSRSALEWLIDARECPVIMLRRSYRCHNPRLLRFASTLFYDAGVKPSSQAEYYQLSYEERKLKFSPRTLLFYSTSALPPELRHEQLIFEGQKPGIANQTEALLCAYAFYDGLKRYPLEELTIIAPYRKQVQIIRNLLSLSRARAVAPEQQINETQWDNFIYSRVATVDSFQGGESDMVIICYVRSNEKGSIGFIDNPNRINVAHTRCRREINIIGDLEFLKHNARNNIFVRMERAFRRDGQITEVNAKQISALN
ncbi:MAG: AAA domain-containing protein [Victivallaceae bacterium]|nr:AAA domain-containing protein [Victivallaceae bacterium]